MEAPKAALERVIGCTSLTSAAVAVVPGTGDLVYAAGCVVVLYSVSRNKQLRFFRARQAVHSIAVTADGQYVAAGQRGRKPTVQIWSLSTGAVVAELTDHHAYGVSTMAFSPDGKILITAGFRNDRNLFAWNWRADAEAARRIGSGKLSQKVLACSWFPDGSGFVTAGEKHLKFWDAAPLHAIVSKEAGVGAQVVLSSKPAVLSEAGPAFETFVDLICLAPTPAATASTADAPASQPAPAYRTYALSSAGMLCCFDASRLMCQWVSAKMSAAFALCLSRKPTVSATTSGKDSSAASAQPATESTGSTRESVIVAGSDGVVRSFAVGTLAFEGTLPLPPAVGAANISVMDAVPQPVPGAVYPAALAVKSSPDGCYTHVLYGDRTLVSWDIAGKGGKPATQYRAMMGHAGPIWDITAVPYCTTGEADGADTNVFAPGTFATASADCTVRLWNLHPRATLTRKELLGKAKAGGSKRQLLASDAAAADSATPNDANDDAGTPAAPLPHARPRNLYSREQLAVLYVDGDQIAEDTSKLTDASPAASSAAGVFGSSSWPARSVIRSNFDAELPSPAMALDVGVRSLAAHPSGRFLASGDKQGNVRVFDLSSSAIAAMEVAHDGEVSCLAYAPTSGRLLVSGSRDRLVHVFDTRSAAADTSKHYGVVTTLADHTSSVTAVCFSHTDDQVVTAGADGMLVFHRVAPTPLPSAADITVTRSRTSVAPYGGIHDIALDNSSRNLVTAGADKRVHVWSLKAAKMVRSYKLEPDAKDLNRIAVDPSGMFVAVASVDRVVRIHDFYSGAVVAMMSGHGELVTGLLFTADCKRLITTSTDGTIMVWKLLPALTKAMLERLLEIEKAKHASAAMPAALPAPAPLPPKAEVASSSASAPALQPPSQQHVSPTRAVDARLHTHAGGAGSSGSAAAAVPPPPPAPHASPSREAPATSIEPAVPANVANPAPTSEAAATSAPPELAVVAATAASPLRTQDLELDAAQSPQPLAAAGEDSLSVLDLGSYPSAGPASDAGENTAAAATATQQPDGAAAATAAELELRRSVLPAWAQTRRVDDSFAAPFVPATASAPNTAEAASASAPAGTETHPSPLLDSILTLASGGNNGGHGTSSSNGGVAAASAASSPARQITSADGGVVSGAGGGSGTVAVGFALDPSLRPTSRWAQVVNSSSPPSSPLQKESTPSSPAKAGTTDQSSPPTVHLVLSPTTDTVRLQDVASPTVEAADAPAQDDAADAPSKHAVHDSVPATTTNIAGGASRVSPTKGSTMRGGTSTGPTRGKRGLSAMLDASVSHAALHVPTDEEEEEDDTIDEEVDEDVPDVAAQGTAAAPGQDQLSGTSGGAGAGAGALPVTIVSTPSARPHFPQPLDSESLTVESFSVSQGPALGSMIKAAKAAAAAAASGGGVSGSGVPPPSPAPARSPRKGAGQASTAAPTTSDASASSTADAHASPLPPVPPMTPTPSTPAAAAGPGAAMLRRSLSSTFIKRTLSASGIPSTPGPTGAKDTAASPRAVASGSVNRVTSGGAAAADAGSVGAASEVGFLPASPASPAARMLSTPQRPHTAPTSSTGGLFGTTRPVGLPTGPAPSSPRSPLSPRLRVPVRLVPSVTPTATATPSSPRRLKATLSSDIDALLEKAQRAAEAQAAVAAKLAATTAADAAAVIVTVPTPETTQQPLPASPAPTAADAILASPALTALADTPLRSTPIPAVAESRASGVLRHSIGSLTVLPQPVQRYTDAVRSLQAALSQVTNLYAELGRSMSSVASADGLPVLDYSLTGAAADRSASVLTHVGIQSSPASGIEPDVSASGMAATGVLPSFSLDSTAFRGIPVYSGASLIDATASNTASNTDPLSVLVMLRGSLVHTATQLSGLLHQTGAIGGIAAASASAASASPHATPTAAAAAEAGTEEQQRPVSAASASQDLDVSSYSSDFERPGSGGGAGAATTTAASSSVHLGDTTGSGLFVGASEAGITEGVNSSILSTSTAGPDAAVVAAPVTDDVPEAPAVPTEEESFYPDDFVSLERVPGQTDGGGPAYHTSSTASNGGAGDGASASAHPTAHKGFTVLAAPLGPQRITVKAKRNVLASP